MDDVLRHISLEVISVYRNTPTRRSPGRPAYADGGYMLENIRTLSARRWMSARWHMGVRKGFEPTGPRLSGLIEVGQALISHRYHVGNKGESILWRKMPTMKPHA